MTTHQEQIGSLKEQVQQLEKDFLTFAGMYSLIMEYNKITHEKTAAVRKQNFEEASKIRTEEIRLLSKIHEKGDEVDKMLERKKG